MRKLVLILLILCQIAHLSAQYVTPLTPTELRQINKIIISSAYCDSAREILTEQNQLLNQEIFVFNEITESQKIDIDLVEQQNKVLSLNLTAAQNKNAKLYRRNQVLKLGLTTLCGIFGGYIIVTNLKN